MGFKTGSGTSFRLVKTSELNWTTKYHLPRERRSAPKKLRARIEKYAGAGGVKYRKACREYLRSYDASLNALLEVNKSKPFEKRRSLNSCVEEADKQKICKTLKFPAAVFRAQRSKPGTFRYIWDFRLPTAARQKLLADCIRAIVSNPHPNWLFTERGVPKAIARLISLIEQGNNR